MNATAMSPVIRQLTKILVVAALYYLTARLGFLMALPPGNVTALWPPSGLALAAMLVWGWPMGFGVGAGSFLVNWGMLSGSAAPPVAAAIAAGSVLQAGVGAWLIRRFTQTLPPETIRDTLLAAGLTALAALLEPTIGVTGLSMAGLAPWNSYATLWSTWWLSGFIGMLVAGAFLAFVQTRQKAAAALAHSEAEFRALSDYALTGIGRFDLSGKVLYANKTLAEMFGLDAPEDLLGQGMRPYLSQPEQFSRLIQMLLDSGRIHNQEIDIQTAQSQPRHLLYSATLYNQIISVTVVNITERIQAEKEIRQLSRVVSQMADTLVITDVQGIIEYVNPAFEELTGYSRAETVGQTPRLLKSGQHNPEFYEQLWATILRGDVFQGEVINRKKDGELYYEAKTITPIRNAAGEIVQFVATGKDITEHKKMEADLRRREEEYRLIADNTGDVIWLLDLESSGFTYVSPSVEKLRGYTPQEVMTQTMQEVLTPDSLAKVTALLPERLAVFAQNPLMATYTEELDQVRKDGSVVNTEVTTTFVVNDAGKVQVVGISRDITERKQATILQETVYRIAEAAQAAESLQELYPQIHRHIAEVMYAENFYIALYDEANDLMSFVYAVDERELFTTKRVHPGTGPTAQVLRTGQSLLFSAQKFELNLDINIEVVGEPHEVWLGVPLVAHGKTIGVMAVQHYSNPQAYTARDQQMLEFVSSQVATAIDRKQAEEAIRLIEKRNSAIIENAPDGMVLLDHKGRFKFVGPSTSRIFGYTSEEILGTDSKDKIHPDDLPAIMDLRKRLQSNPEKLVTAQYRFLHKNGQYRWIESIYTDLLLEPSVNAIVVNFQDITERKQAETDLDQSRQKLEAALNALPDLLFELDDTRHIVDFRTPAPELLYVPPDHFIGKTMNEILPAEAANIMEQALVEAGQTGRHSGATYSLPMPSGVEWFEVSISAKPEPGKTQPHFIVLVRDITGRKQAEAALFASEEKYRSLIDSQDAAISTVDAEGVSHYMNQIGAARFAASPEAVIGKKLHDLFPAPVADFQLNLVRQVIASGDGIVTEYQLLLAGKPSWRRVSIQPIRDAAGQVSLAMVNSTDITERKQAIVMLQESQDNLELAQAIAHLGSWELDPHAGAGLAWSKEMYQLFHFDPSQGVPPFAEFMEKVHPDDRQLLLAAEQRAIETGTQVTVEYRANPGGVNEPVQYFKANLHPVLDAQGQLKRMSGTVLDITEIKQADEQIRESERQLKQAQQIARLGSWELDLRRNELKWSDEVYRIFGLEPQEFAASYEAFLEAIHPDDREMVNQVYTDSLKNRQPYEVVHRLLLNDGEIRFVQEKCETYFDETGVPLRSVGTIQDTTELRRMELDIRERVKELTCLFGVSRLLDDHTASEVAMCRQIVELIIPAMQYPALTVAVIELNGNRYSTNGYSEALSHQLSAAIMVNDREKGRVLVYYTQNEPFIIPEEQALIDNLARMFGLWLERKQSETALRASDERFRQLADNIREIFWIRDMVRQEIIYISPAYEFVWGRTCQSLYENPREYVESILPEDMPIFMAMVQKQNLGEPVEMQYRARRPDGSVRWVWERSFPIFDDAGNLTRTAGVSTDITEVKTAQNQLEALNRNLERLVEERTAEVRQSETTYRALFENSNDGIFLMSPAGEELQANQRALDMVGYTLDEWRTINNNQLVPADQQQDADARLEAVLRGEHVPLYERTFISKDGKRIAVEINLSAIRDATGKVMMVQSVVRDITERKKAEEALRDSRDKLSAANAALEKASRLKDEFLASMSHELRTPLSGILGLSEALQLQTYGELNEKQLKSLRNIESSGRHLLDLINDILDLSKIEAGKLDLQIAPCSASELCQASLQLTKGMAHQKRLNVSFSMNPVTIILQADARRLKQMIVNLLSNAVKFTPEGGKLGLEVQGDEAEEIVSFSVWDKGIGIKPEEMGKLFKPFVQLDSSLARQYSGTGLGLSLVQRMAELHGGSIKVESTPGEGSRFTIILPWSPEATEPAPVEPHDASSLKNTLVIEDNALDAEQVTRYLKEINLANIVHPTIQGALEKAAALHPGVILLDLHLPDGSGMELLALLKADPRTRNIPVIITSVEERRAEALKLGALGYLVKPFSQQELRAELARATALVPPAEPVMVIASRAPLVLIADDNELILETVAEFLEVKGFRVIATRSGFELLERAPEVNPNIMLVDIQMPGLDGLETMRRLRAHSNPTIAATPIIAVTALAMTGDRERCLQAGADDYMSKPIILAQLVKRIKQLL